VQAVLTQIKGPGAKLPRKLVGPLPRPPTGVFSVIVPEKLPEPERPGERRRFDVIAPGGVPLSVPVPHGLECGDTFAVRAPDTSHMFVSTLPRVPGHRVVAAWPPLMADHVVDILDGFESEGGPAQSASALEKRRVVDAMTQQMKLQAHALGANSLLGMSVSLTALGAAKLFVSLLATPCCVVPDPQELSRPMFPAEAL
jgi:uncharacterized protein YbjQ (UPF0145 family)